MSAASKVNEVAVTLIAEGVRLEGHLTFSDVTRVHGVLKGEIEATDGSTLIFGETSLVEGTVRADTLIIDGYVEGRISARKQVLISRTGRVVGEIHSPSVKMEFGAYFDGKCNANPTHLAPQPANPTGAAELKPAAL